MPLALRLALAAFLLESTLYDLRLLRVPNRLTLPVLVLGAAWAGLVWRSGWFLLPCLAIYALWAMSCFGAGDAKLLMALFAFTPPGQFRLLALCLAGLSLLGGLAVGVREYGSLPLFLLGCWNALRGLVSKEEMLRSRRAFTWAFALGGACFLCLA